MVYQYRIETNLLQLFAHLGTSEWFSTISVIFEVNIVAEQKQAKLVTNFLSVINLHCHQVFYCPPPLPPFRRPNPSYE